MVMIPFEVSTPSAISAGIEVWTWVIAEKPDMEVALMTEILAAWADSIKFEKGIFSHTQKWVSLHFLWRQLLILSSAMMIRSTIQLATALPIRISLIVPPKMHGVS
jgi:hypothetical protein